MVSIGALLHHDFLRPDVSSFSDCQQVCSSCMSPTDKTVVPCANSRTVRVKSIMAIRAEGATPVRVMASFAGLGMMVISDCLFDVVWGWWQQHGIDHVHHTVACNEVGHNDHGVVDHDRVHRHVDGDVEVCPLQCWDS